MEQIEMRSGHWDDFYNNASEGMVMGLPSQFSAFVASELPADALIIDMGCGNGRDSVFFCVMVLKSYQLMHLKMH